MRRLNFNQAGDTIVEVMASIAVLGLALAAAYLLSNRSFNTAVHTHDRIQAMKLAEGQIEFLKDKGLKGQTNTLITTYNLSPFCFDDETGDDMPAASCGDYKGSIYSIAVTYCAATGGCGEGNVFTVKTTWTAGGGGQNRQLTLYYKPPS